MGITEVNALGFPLEGRIKALRGSSRRQGPNGVAKNVINHFVK